MRERLYRTVLSILVVTGAVLAVRWTIRSVMTRAYHAENAVAAEGEAEMPVVPAQRVWLLANIIPKDLHVNLSGLVVKRRAERLHMPYSLAVDVAEEKARSANWERLDDENALTIKNLSGMERIYKTPEGSIVMREVRPIRGDDSLMEDYTIPAETIPVHGDMLTPDVLARRSARHVKELMPAVVRDVMVGSPLMTELIERGVGAAFIVHCVVDMSVKDVERAVENAARKAGWIRAPFANEATRLLAADGGKKGGAMSAASEHPEFASYHPGAPKASWFKENLTFYYDVLTRKHGAGCDVNYRFTDDEVYIPTKGKTNEN